MTDRPAEAVVVDASVFVDLLAGTPHAAAATARLAGTSMHAPAHVDAEVLSALGRLQRAGELTATEVEAGLATLAAAPITRHSAHELLAGAWSRRADLRLTYALYVELATLLRVPLLTTDQRLARASGAAEAIAPKVPDQA
ncbi:type II toxin-antitoxin system VapC family toxin [Pseudonocardia adelaidensis]|uniref:Ribonuclease VapC n=1 Tax=Pseudonocardia adelaidensis TaxID=648754 RepID=A0ABP9N8P3_9PSEU